MLMEVAMETFWGIFNAFFFYLAGVNEAADASEARCPPVGEDSQPALGGISPPFYDLAALICSSVLYFRGEGSHCSPKDCCYLCFGSQMT